MTATETADLVPPADGERGEPGTLYELFREITTSHPDRPAFRIRGEHGWSDVSWGEHAREVARISGALYALGVRKGDRVAVLSGTRLEWVQCDSAIVNVGAVTVGIYHSNLAQDCAYILEHSEAKVVFVEDDAQLQKVVSMRADLPELERIVVFDGEGDPSVYAVGWSEFLDLGKDVSEEQLAQIGRAIEPDDLASLVYTSGTTGVPKGAMITHRNLVFVSKSASIALQLGPGYSTLLFLPLAHVFARLIIYMCQRSLLTVAFSPEIGKVAADLKEVRPHFIASVPRIYEKVHERVVTAAADAGGFRKKLFDWAVGIGLRVARRRLAHRPVSGWLRLRHRIADRLVLCKVRAAFGDRLQWAISGAAPLSVTINEFFHACGVKILEGIGQTENTSLSNVNRLDQNKLGTVGPVVPGVEMKLAADGEVLFRGPNVMKGYFKNPEATAETIDADGWLYSGDIGEIDEDGFLTITDRKKDLIITAGGKNVAPQRIERRLRMSRFLSQVVACGDRRKFIAALVTLNYDNVRSWARSNGLTATGDDELARDERVRELIEREIAEHNADLASFESVKKFRILPGDLSVESGELTASLKVKRKVVCEKHLSLIEEMYGD